MIELTSITVAGMEISSTIIWIAIGLVGGAMAAMIHGGRRLLLFDMLVGVVAALAGGWSSTLIMGDDTPQLFIMATLTAVFVAALCLLVYNWLVARASRR